MKALSFCFLICSVFGYSYIYAQDKDLGVKKRPTQYGFFYGVFAGYQQEIYKGLDNDLMALPAIGYRGEKLNILGPRISYKLFQQDELTLSALLQYRFAGYDASDSRFFDGMNDRDASLDAGFSFVYKQNDWSVSNTFSTNVLDNSNGSEINTQLGKTFYFGPIFVEPHIEVSYWDSHYVNYYYGVDELESSPQRNKYKGGSALNKKIGLNVSTPILFGGFTRLSINHTWYDSVISNSPLTESDSSFGARITFTRFF